MFQVLAFSLLLQPSLASPIYPVFLTGLSLSAGPLTLVSITPELLRPKSTHLGLLLGFHRSLDVAGAVLMSSLLGFIQDITGGYRAVVLSLLFLAVLAFITSIIFWWTASAYIDVPVDRKTPSRSTQAWRKSMWIPVSVFPFDVNLL